MKVRVVLSVEVDKHEWAREYGIEPSEVADDVRGYILTGIQGDDMFLSAEVK